MSAAFEIAIARHRRVRGQRRTADGAQVDVELEVPFDAQRARHRARRFDLTRVALAVVNGQRAQGEALRPGNGRGGVRVEPAAQEDYRSHLVNWVN